MTKPSTAATHDPITGKFLPGNNANPRGRIPVSQGGRPNRATLLLQQIEDRAEEVVEKAIQMALKGDPRMIALLTNKILPDLKSVDVKGDASSMPNLTIINQPTNEPTDDAKLDDETTGDELQVEK